MIASWESDISDGPTITKASFQAISIWPGQRKLTFKIS